MQQRSSKSVHGHLGVIRILTLVRFLRVAQRREFFQRLSGQARFVYVASRFHQRMERQLAASAAASIRRMSS
jgi:hypothetical protein